MKSLSSILKSIYTSGDSMTVMQLLKKLIDAVDEYEADTVPELVERVDELETKVDDGVYYMYSIQAKSEGSPYPDGFYYFVTKKYVDPSTLTSFADIWNEFGESTIRNYDNEFALRVSGLNDKVSIKNNYAVGAEYILSSSGIIKNIMTYTYGESSATHTTTNCPTLYSVHVKRVF